MAVFKCILAALVLATAAATDPVLLGFAGDFVILAKTGISTVPASAITGNIGVSPIAATAMTGFNLIKHSSNTFSTSTQIKGQAYASDYTSPTPSTMTTAISDMQTAYNDAAVRPLSDGANIDIKAGLISGTTFTAGVYNWGSNIMFSSDIYLKGSSTDIFIFQTTGNVVVGSGAKVTLLADVAGNGKPKASNIVWQVAGFVDAGTTSHLEGVFLVKTHAAFKTGSSLDGRILAQTACTLDAATITQPKAEVQRLPANRNTHRP
ncbi:IBP-8 [Baffinella frigidus]|nr:IBP-8 [Cryptophyta sp. CCMP2293]